MSLRRTATLDTAHTTATLEHLETIPGRALEFLRGVTTTRPARLLLVAAGYTDAEHALGWRLLLKASGHTLSITEAPDSGPSDVAAREAIVALAAWVGPHVRLMGAALDREHATQGAFVTAGLSAASGADAVVEVATLLDRLDALQHGPHDDRRAGDDHAALAVLAARGIDAAERARLRALVTTAQTLGSTVDAPAPLGVDPATHERDLRALYAWYRDWSATAHAKIKRRDYLIRLGLAARRKPAATPVAASPAAQTAPRTS